MFDKKSTNELLERLAGHLHPRTRDLSFLEAKSSEEPFSEIPSFLQHFHDRGVFFKLEKSDLKDFLLLCLFTKKLLGLWTLMELASMDVSKERVSLALMERVEEFQKSEYNDRRSPECIVKDFQILGAFENFKKTRVRLTNVGRKRKFSMKEFFEEKRDHLSFLLQSEEIARYLARSEDEPERPEAPQPNSNGPLFRISEFPSRESLDLRESFFKFRSE